MKGAGRGRGLVRPTGRGSGIGPQVPHGPCKGHGTKQQWGKSWNSEPAVGYVQGQCPHAAPCSPSWTHSHTHTHILPNHFSPIFSPMCFPAPRQGQAGSLGFHTDTNKRNTFIFNLQIHPLDSHAHSARSCPDRRGAPGTVGVCQPKTATADEGGTSWVSVPVHNALVIQQQGKAWCCGYLGQGCEYLVENQDGMGCCEVRVRSCVGPGITSLSFGKAVWGQAANSPEPVGSGGC